MRIKILAAALAAGTLSAPAYALTEIQWWHSMGGALGEALNGVADKFNASQKDYKIVPTFKGTYPESMTAAIARLPVITRAIVAATPIRGGPTVMARMMNALSMPPVHNQTGWRAAAPIPPTPWRTTRSAVMPITAETSVEKATAPKIPTRSPSLPITAA